MTRDAVKTLFHPFATGILPPPGAEERVLFLGAEAGYDLPDAFAAQITAVQPFRPLHNALAKRGVTAQPFAEGDGYDMTLILMGRHRGENEHRLADALKRTRAGGWIIVAGAKEDGVQSLRKRTATLGLDGDHLSKYHAQAFWFARPQDATDAIAALEQPDLRVLDRFSTRPGMFSHGEVDAGSAFLARYLPKGYRKLAADFGAGWGYLAAELHAVSPEIEGIDLYEADHAALEAARRNLDGIAPRLSARYHWLDLAREEVRGRYDLIVMNPPFHEGHAAEPALGQAFIRTAANALKQGGDLLLVANRGLPYEPTLRDLFRESGETARNARFKVLWARK